MDFLEDYFSKPGLIGKLSPIVAIPRGVAALRQHPELLHRVSKEANTPTAIGAVPTWLSPVPRRVQTALENPMGHVAAVPPLAAPLLEVRALRSAVVAWVPPAGRL